MAQYIDSYYLIDNRDSNQIDKFLKQYLPINKESAEEYPVSLFSEHPTDIFHNVNDLLTYLEHHANCEYSVYWRNVEENSIIKHFMVHYTNDGKMIFGVSMDGKEPSERRSVTLFYEIKGFLNSTVGCITVEEPPPSSAIRFIEFCQSRYIPT